MAIAIGSVAAAGLTATSTPRLRAATGKESRSRALKLSPVEQFRQSKGLSQAYSGSRRIVVSEYRRGGGSGDFVAGFLLGGVVFGALGYLLAPQVNRSLAEIGKENGALPKKPKKYLDDDEGIEVDTSFVDEGIEVDIEKTRKSLNEKIQELNAALDSVSSQLRETESDEILKEVQASA